MKKFKQGIISFYTVAFATLILVVMTASFATVIISEVTRTSNDDLSQSAYDAALAGVEDAKLAYANYQRCKASGASAKKPESGGVITCSDIIWWVEDTSASNNRCDMVGHILGRIGKNDSGAVLISETSSNSGQSMQQYYTCVTINMNLSDYKADLSPSDQVKVVQVPFDNPSSINTLKFSWYSNKEGETLNFGNAPGNRVQFGPLDNNNAPTPPVIELQLIQADAEFTLSEVNGQNNGNNTDRATLYLVPTEKALSDSEYQFASTNSISATNVAETNNLGRNKPFPILCSNTGDYACSVEIGLPKAYNGGRSNETFMFVVSLPYGKPGTDFSMEFCTSSRDCNTINSDGSVTNQAVVIKGAQVQIDSTGRANDVYRRVETRLETADTGFVYPYYALEALDSGDNAIMKKVTTNCEWNFYDNTRGGEINHYQECTP